MRIVAGAFRGKQLEDVGKGDPGAHLRPTTDRVREAMFNLLAHGGYRSPPVPQDMRVLDLFAGTGALGLEALSRGAAEVLLLDNGKAALNLQRANIKRVGATGVTSQKADVLELDTCSSAPFDLIFLDPPYGTGMGVKALQNARSRGWLAEDAVIVLEEGQRLSQIAGFQLKDARRYAETWVHILSAI